MNLHISVIHPVVSTTTNPLSPFDSDNPDKEEED